MSAMPSLFDPIQLGDLLLPNRIFMAPLTRLRGTAEHIPTPIMADYYAQRATAGLILSEGIPVDPLGVGYANVPGLWSTEQTEAWKPVTAAVHRAGGPYLRTNLARWAASPTPTFLDGQLPVAPSAIAATGTVSHLRQRPFVTPRPRNRRGQRRRRSLPPRSTERSTRGLRRRRTPRGQRLPARPVSTGRLQPAHRTRYGGPIENRARLMLECADAAISVFGSGRVGMHLAPRGDAHGISDSNLEATFSYVARELGRRKLAFIAAREHPGAQTPLGRASNKPWRRHLRRQRGDRPADRPAASRRRQSRRRSLRQTLYSQPRPAYPLCCTRAPQPSERRHFLRLERGRLYRLPRPPELSHSRSQHASPLIR